MCQFQEGCGESNFIRFHRLFGGSTESRQRVEETVESVDRHECLTPGIQRFYFLVSTISFKICFISTYTYVVGSLHF